MLWSHLVTRYQNLELSTLMQNFVEDPEFKMILVRGINQTLEPEINDLEAKLNMYGIPLPPRPPKSVNTPAKTETMRDQWIFQQVFSGMQFFLDIHVSDLRVMLNSSLRRMLMKFLERELERYDDLVIYGVAKGWIGQPPAYRP